jgi:hypothetical protein
MAKYSTPEEDKKLIQKQDAEIATLLAEFAKVKPAAAGAKAVASADKVKALVKSEED